MNVDLSLSKYWDWVYLEKFEENYNAKFVCESSIKTKNGWRDASSLIFYSEVPHPNGSNYMAFSYDYIKDEYVVSDGISVANIEISGVVADNGDVIYSRFRHDYRFSKDKSVWIDGGRDYTRSCAGKSVIMMIIDGQLKVIDDVVDDIEEDFEEEKWEQAYGTKGCLIRLMTDPEQYIFRIYDETYGFIDYEITHHDLDMIIDDKTAAFYSKNGKYYLDYTPDSMQVESK